jgi:hypothetical protein
VDATTICGTDLHILKGDTPEVAAGRLDLRCVNIGLDLALRSSIFSTDFLPKF